jgi:hypothetical protein
VPHDDGLIAAIARAHGFSIATRNQSNFEGTGVHTINPGGESVFLPNASSGGAHRIGVDRAARHRHRHRGGLRFVVIIGRGLVVRLRNSCEPVGFGRAAPRAVILGEI